MNKVLAWWSRAPYALKYRTFEVINAVFLFCIGIGTLLDVFPAYIQNLQDDNNLGYYLYNFNGINLMIGAATIFVVLMKLKSEYVRTPLSLMSETTAYVVVLTSSLAYLIGYAVEWGNLGYAGCAALGAIYLVSQMFMACARLLTIHIKLQEQRHGT